MTVVSMIRGNARTAKAYKECNSVFLKETSMDAFKRTPYYKSLGWKRFFLRPHHIKLCIESFDDERTRAKLVVGTKVLRRMVTSNKHLSYEGGSFSNKELLFITLTDRDFGYRDDTKTITVSLLSDITLEFEFLSDLHYVNNRFLYRITERSLIFLHKNDHIDRRIDVLNKAIEELNK
jgi:hypothetical protein